MPEAAASYEVVSRAVICIGGMVLVAQGIGDTFTHLPGGHVEAGEIPGDALTREVREELGREVSEVRFLGTFQNTYDDRAGRHVEEENHVFAVKLYPVLQEVPAEARESHLKLRWVAIGDLARPDVNLLPPAIRGYVELASGAPWAAVWMGQR